MLYWDDVNGCVVDNSKYCPIHKGNDEIWIESWWVVEGEIAIDFAYSDDIKKEGVLSFARNEFFKKHKVTPISLRYIIIPKNKYEELEREFAETH